MLKIINKACLVLSCCCVFFVCVTANANISLNTQIICKPFKDQKNILSAFYFPATQKINIQELNAHKQAISKLNVLDYSVTDINSQGELKLSASNKQNLLTLARWIKKNKIKARLVISIGNWYSQGAFSILLKPSVQQRFINSIVNVLKEYGITGIDIDWENEFQPKMPGVANFSLLIKHLRQAFNSNGMPCATISLDIPSAVNFAKIYPSAKGWAPYVNWANLMAYAYYGGNPPYTELDGTLGEVHAPYGGKPPNYSSVSIVNTLQYYTKHGLPKNKILVAVPFYGNVHYTHYGGAANQNGLRQKVLDAKQVFTIPYYEVWSKYGISGYAKNGTHIYSYTFEQPASISGAKSYWVLRYLKQSKVGNDVYIFISYQDPKALKQTVRYVIDHGYRGFSAWTLDKDLLYSNKHSLLRTLYTTMH